MKPPNQILNMLAFIVYCILFILSLYVAHLIVGDTYNEFPITALLVYIAMPVVGLTLGAILTRSIIIAILKITELILQIFKNGLKK